MGTRLKLVGAETYTGPRTGGASTGTIMKRGDVYEFADKDVDAVLALTYHDAQNNEKPLFVRVSGDEAEQEAAAAPQPVKRTRAPARGAAAAKSA